MLKFRRAFRQSANVLDERVDEWIEVLKEDAPMYPRDTNPALPRQSRGPGRHRQKHTMFKSLNRSRST